MKVIASNELRSRLTNAAANGSTIARDILGELKSRRNVTDIIRGSVNYFSTKRIKSREDGTATMRIIFTACTKDVRHKNFPDRLNPQAQWFPENRADIEPSTFIGYFKNLPEYSNDEVGFFISAITVDSRVTVRLHDTMADIYEAYNGENYTPVAQPGEMTLHNSCMRHEKVSRNAADFYHNFAGAKIIVARDSSNNILGRAIVWEKAIWVDGDTETTVSVMDRVYFSHTFVTLLIYDFARSQGIRLRKMYNDYSHQRCFVALNPIGELHIEPGTVITDQKMIVRVPASRWHKYGAPYMDTFSELYIREDLSLELSNTNAGSPFASLRGTSGYASRYRYFCPRCGIQHSGNCNNEYLCKACKSDLFTDTDFGKLLNARPIKYNDKVYPSALFCKGRPSPTMLLFLRTERLFDE